MVETEDEALEYDAKVRLEDVIRMVAEATDLAESQVSDVLEHFFRTLLAAVHRVESKGKKVDNEAIEDVTLEVTKRAVKLQAEALTGLEDVAKELRERFGDTTSEIDKEELSETARRILELVEEEEGELTVSEIATRLKLTTSDVHNALNELRRAGAIAISKTPFGMVVYKP